MNKENKKTKPWHDITNYIPRFIVSVDILTLKRFF